MLMGSPYWTSDTATSLVLVKPTGSSSSPGRRSARPTRKTQLGTSILRPLEELHPSCLRKATVKQVDTIFYRKHSWAHPSSNKWRGGAASKLSKESYLHCIVMVRKRLETTSSNLDGLSRR